MGQIANQKAVELLFKAKDKLKEWQNKKMTAIMIGLDLGTQGARAMAVDEKGNILAEASKRYAVINTEQDPWKAQDALDWEAAAMQVLADTTAQLKEQLDGNGDQKVYIAVDGTSGTIVPLDENYRPLMHGIMYNDARSKGELPAMHAITKDLEEKMGYVMGSSYALPKILWVKNQRPEIYEKTALFAHQGDFLSGKLSGNYRLTDYSNALKTGYDLIDEKWDEQVMEALGLDMGKLPQVTAPGAVIGTILPDMARQLGLPEDTVIAAGATDGYAACVASGTVYPGQYNVTIGTTLVVKGVTSNFVKDPEGRVYSHKHPQGYWYPGGASNVGGICLNTWFDENRFDELNAKALDVTPTGNVIYPLLAQGERFPFVNAEAVSFSEMKDESEIARYAGTMEGVAYTERLCFDTLESLGCEVGDTIMITGGAVKSPAWSQIQADVMGKKICQPKIAETVFGTAILAGSTARGKTLCEAAQEMVQIERVFTPDEKKHEQYERPYARFVQLMKERGYIK